MSSSSTLAPGLKQRHVTMLSIAGAIGAGLFSYLVIFCILSILIVMLILPEHRMEVIATGALALSIVCIGAIFNSKKKTLQNIEMARTENA